MGSQDDATDGSRLRLACRCHLTKARLHQGNNSSGPWPWQQRASLREGNLREEIATESKLLLSP